MNTIFPAIRSYFVVAMVLFLFGSLTTSCKSKGGTDPDIDPRDQYVGAYEGGEKGYQSVIAIGTLQFNPEFGPTNITVSKSSNPKEIYIESANQSLKVTAELNGENFTVIDKNSNQIFVPPNNNYTGSYKATGVFGKDQASGKLAFVLTATTETLKDGTAIRKVETYNGTKK
ncbi:MAG: hypothetical protein H7319_03750 [Spirosoma sp.]|nr:hypothetical protein [Spirosoma sp.]